MGEGEGGKLVIFSSGGGGYLSASSVVSILPTTTSHDHWDSRFILYNHTLYKPCRGPGQDRGPCTGPGPM